MGAHKHLIETCEHGVIADWSSFDGYGRTPACTECEGEREAQEFKEACERND
jgi:hypothetical protein